MACSFANYCIFFCFSSVVFLVKMSTSANTFDGTTEISVAPILGLTCCVIMIAAATYAALNMYQASTEHPLSGIVSSSGPPNTTWDGTAYGAG